MPTKIYERVYVKSSGMCGWCIIEDDLAKGNLDDGTPFWVSIKDTAPLWMYDSPLYKALNEG